jgi:endonuclease-3
MNVETMQDRVERILDLLAGEYGVPVWQEGEPPLDELVVTILSQNTASVNTRRAYAALRARFPDWDAVRKADVGKIVDAIRPGGLAEIKAPRIKGILQQIYEEQGRLDLDWLRSEDSGRVRDYLLRFKGVGEKTAACVLLFSLGRPVLPVDTHVYRVSKRVSLVGPTTAVDEAHRMLQALVPAERVFEFHINLIRHGRKVCKARTPMCPACVIKGECDYFARAYA